MSKTVAAVFFLLLGATAGLTAGMFLFDDTQESLDDSNQRYESQDSEDGGEVEKRSAVIPNSARRSSFLSSAQGGTLGEIIRNAKVSGAKNGDGVITVTAIDESGAAISDVIFELSSPYDSGEATPETIEEKVSAYIQRLRFEEASTSKATTDDSGMINFGGLGDGTFKLQIDSEEWMIASRTRNLRDLLPGASVRLTLEPCAYLPVTVLMPDGSRARRASLSFRQENFGKGEIWHSSKPVVKVAPGDFAVEATIHGHDEYKTKEPVDVTLVGGRENQPITLQLAPVLKIRGAIDEGDRPKSRYVTIYAKRFENEVPSAKSILNSRKQTSSWDGSFNLEIDEPGKYALVVGRRGQRPQSDVLVVEVINKSVDVILKLHPLKREDHVEVRITGPEGKKLRDVDITPGVKSDRGSTSGGGQEFKQSEGVYWIIHKDDSGLRGKNPRYYVKVSCNFGSKTVYYEKTAASVAEVEFAEPCDLAVQVTGATKDKSDELVVNVSLANADNQTRVTSSLESQGNGQFRGKDLQPGLYVVALSIRSREWGRQQLTEIKVDVKPGKNSAVLSMPSLYEVTIRFEGDNVPNRVSLRRQSNRGRFSSMRANVEDGRAVFKNVAAGEYMVEPRGGKMEMMTIQVPSQTSVVFKADVINCLKVQNCPEDSKAYAAGLRQGDIIFAVDGKEFGNISEMQVALVSGDPEKKISIQRGSGTVELKIKLMDALQGGGADVNPASR